MDAAAKSEETPSYATPPTAKVTKIKLVQIQVCQRLFRINTLANMSSLPNNQEAPAEQNLGLRGQLQIVVCLFVPAIVALNLIMVSFHFGDDFDHAERAYTVAHLSLLPMTLEFTPASSGGKVDMALDTVVRREKDAVFGLPRYAFPRHPYFASRATPWTKKEVFREFPGAASYLPVLYVPQAIGIVIGERIDLSVENTLLLSRMLNGFSALAVIALALRFLPVGLMGTTIALLALPKTLLSFASHSLDPLILAGAVVAIAFSYKLIASDWRPKLMHWACLLIAIASIAGVRPPLAAFGLLPLYCSWRRGLRTGVVFSIAAGLMPLAWFAAVLPQVRDFRFGEQAALVDRVINLLGHGVPLVTRTISENCVYYVLSFVGEIGWGDAPHSHLRMLPTPIYLLILVSLGVAFLFNLSNKVKIPLGVRIIAALIGALYSIGIFLAMGVACDGCTAESIGGVQGRYFVPALLLFGISTAGLLRRDRLLNSAFPAFLGFVVVVSFTTEAWVGMNYYWVR